MGIADDELKLNYTAYCFIYHPRLVDIIDDWDIFVETNKI